MKRLISVSLAALVVFLGLGCGDSNPSKPPSDTSGIVKKNIGDNKESGKKKEYKFND
jgi:hypothetical protein